MLSVFLLLPFYVTWFYTLSFKDYYYKSLVALFVGNLFQERISWKVLERVSRVYSRELMRYVPCRKRYNIDLDPMHDCQYNIAIFVCKRQYYIRDNIIRVRYWYCDQMSTSTTAQAVDILQFYVLRWYHFDFEYRVSDFTCWNYTSIFIHVDIRATAEYFPLVIRSYNTLLSAISRIFGRDNLYIIKLSRYLSNL